MLYRYIDPLSHTDYKRMLGELQFAFVCFLVGHVYDAFEQWKALTALLCSCDELLVTRPDLFMAFLGVWSFANSLT